MSRLEKSLQEKWYDHEYANLQENVATFEQFAKWVGLQAKATRRRCDDLDQDQDDHPERAKSRVPKGRLAIITV